MLCQFLLYNAVNQLYVCIYPLFLESPSACSLHPSIPPPSPQSTELSSLWYIAASHEPPVIHVTLRFNYPCLVPGCQTWLDLLRVLSHLVTTAGGLSSCSHFAGKEPEAERGKVAYARPYNHLNLAPPAFLSRILASVVL